MVQRTVLDPGFVDQIQGIDEEHDGNDAVHHPSPSRGTRGRPSPSSVNSALNAYRTVRSTPPMVARIRRRTPRDRTAGRVPPLVTGCATVWHGTEFPVNPLDGFLTVERQCGLLDGGDAPDAHLVRVACSRSECDCGACRSCAVIPVSTGVTPRSGIGRWAVRRDSELAGGHRSPPPSVSRERTRSINSVDSESRTRSPS